MKAMVVRNRLKLNSVTVHAHFNVENRQIMFVNQFCFLGVNVDCEITLELLYEHVFSQVEVRTDFLMRLSG